jgi:hypothetical protein
MTACCSLVLVLHSVGCGRQASSTFAVVSTNIGSGITDDPRSDPKPLPAALSVSAKELVELWSKDKDKAEKDYKRKKVEVSGVVKAIDHDGRGSARIYLDSNPSVCCYTEDKEPWAKATPGQKIKLRGTWEGFSSQPVLDPADIVELGDNPAVVVSAGQLAKEFAADRKTAESKYDKKYLLVDGEIADVQTRGDGQATIRLQGDGQTAVVCYFTSLEKNQTDGLKKGMKLKLSAQVDSAKKDNEVGLKDCLAIKQSK